MIVNRLADYEFLWTTEKADHALFTIRAYGQVEYLIYHIPTKTVKTVSCGPLGRRIVDSMIASGVAVLDDLSGMTLARQDAPAAH